MIYIIHRKHVFDGGSMKSWNAVTAYSEVYRTGIMKMDWSKDFRYKKEAVAWCKQQNINWITEADWRKLWNDALLEAEDGDIYTKATKILNKRFFYLDHDDKKNLEGIDMNKNTNYPIMMEFEKYVSELLNGEHEGTLYFRSEMFDALKCFKSGDSFTTNVQEVRDTLVKFGFNIKPSNVGWKFMPLSKAVDSNISDSVLENARQEGRLEMARKGADTMFFHNMPYNQVFEAFGEVLGEDELKHIQEKAQKDIERFK